MFVKLKKFLYRFDKKQYLNLKRLTEIFDKTINIIYANE